MNHFERFGLEPKLWIEPEILKQRFLELSAELHPDKVRGDKAAAEQCFKLVNESYTTLRNTRTRLLHILEISGAPKEEHVQNVPDAVLEFFTVIASATKEADALLKEMSAANSRMLRAQLMDRAMTQIDSLQNLQGHLRERISRIESNLKQFEGQSSPIKLAQDAAAALGFMERWNNQLQERIAALTFG